VDVFVDSYRIKNPTGLLFGPDGNLYVVSSDTNEIMQYIIKDNIVFETRKFVTDASNALYQPTHLEIFDGKVCVSSFITNDIHCYDENTGESLGKLTVSFDRALVSKENSIVGPDGELYVSDNLRNEITRYDGVTGLFSDVVIKTENEPLLGPSYIEFGPDGNLYVSSDDKIFRFNSDDGTLVDVFVSKNSAGIRNPQGLVFDENYLYVNSYDNNRVLRYHLNNGTFIDEFISSRDNGLLGPIGIVLDKKTNTLYVGSSGTNQILRYDAQTGDFLNKIDLPNVTPHGFVLGKNNTMYVNAFETNHVLSYDLDSKQSVLLLSGDDGLDGPEGLAFDAKNSILYISSYANNKIFQYDVKDNSVREITINAGNGILQKPLGLTLKEDILFISNEDNNEILKYDPKNTTLDIFIRDTGDLIRPGGIAFGPNSHIYVINENDNGVYQYDVKTGSLISIFAKPPTLVKDPKNIALRSIAFTKDDKYMFLSNPSSNEVFAYDIKSEKYIDNFFKTNNMLNYPTGLTLTPDGKYILIVNYGDNTISRFTTEGDFDRLFVNPTDEGLKELREIRFGHDSNLYIMGGVYGDIFRYDGTTGNYLGQYDTSVSYLGILTENILNHKYLLNGIDTRQHDTVIVYDHLLERPYAQAVLQDYVDILSPIDIAWNSFTTNLFSISEPTLKSREITKHTGFFIGMNDIVARGQAITKSVDFTSLITLENFSLDYDASKYISVQNSKNTFTSGPDLVACIVPNFSELTCDNSNHSVELGKIQINAGVNRYLLTDTNLDEYDVIVAYDKTTKEPFAHIPLRDYGTFRISGESFLDWLQYDFAVIPILIVIMIIIPFIFDYTRAIFKILFFAIYFLSGKMKSKTPSPLSLIMSAKKISILIPAHNEEVGIRKSIESALAIDYPNKEIIVIDDNSKDNTWNIANSFAEQGQIKLVSRPPAPSSKASALNHGLNFATGDYVLCMDGDTELDKDALKNAVPYFDDKDTVAFSGNVKILNGDGGVDNLLTKLQTYEYIIAIELGRRFTSALKILLVVSGAFGIFRKDLMKEIHAFDKDTLTEDFDLTLKLRKTRNRIQFLPNSIAYTHCPATWHAWKQQRNRWAYGQLQTLSKNMDLLRNKFTKKDTVSFVDMYVLDIVLSMLFPLGLAVLGIMSLILFLDDTLHILVYPLTFVMSMFVILEFIIFLSATVYSGRYEYLKLSYLVPVMTFFYRPYLRMINLRGYIRAFYKKGSSW
ncbi:MAG: glycosyltransferase, partial [Nitrosopumilus sp.]|nr:glycosyltransferase [Nitrosopumilus sp.]